MDPVTEAAYRRPAPVACTLIRFDLPAGPLCLTDGGFVRFDAGEGGGVELYRGRDPVFGALGSLPRIRDGAEETTTRVSLVLLPETDDAATALGQPNVQGRRVQWWEGVVDPETGELDGPPLLKFDGEIDRPRLGVNAGRAIMLDCGTQAERQVEPNADWRLNSAFHQRIWGEGELGLVHVVNVLKKSEWRERPPNPGLFKRLLNTFVPFTK
jgi:hypothetical protein